MQYRVKAKLGLGLGLGFTLQRLLRLLRLQKAAGNGDYDDYDYDEGRYLFFFDFLLKEKNLLIPAAAGSSPSMQPPVFWPRAGAVGAGAILELCAQLVWCALYDTKDSPKEKKS